MLTGYFMKFALIVMVLIIFSRAVAGGIQTPKSENEYVTSSISLQKTKLKAGSSGTLLISLKPKKGIHINLNPKIEITIDSSSAIIPAGKPEIPQNQKKDFFDPEKPIRQAFMVSGNVKPGAVDLTGTLTYYYCSDAEGWCSKFKQPLNLKVIVTK